jgi:hypothetical protein
MEYMPLLKQLFDVSTFDFFTADENMTSKVLIKGGKR